MGYSSLGCQIGGMRRKIYDERHVILREELLQMRLDAGFKQSELAAILGSPQSYVSKYEIGERNLDFVEVLLICKACGYNPKKLISKIKV